MTKKPYKGWAHIIGGGIAHLQHTVDRAVTWGFARLRSVDKPEKIVEANDPHPWFTKSKRFAKATVGFIGETGDAFYKKYEELKKADVND